MKRFVFDLDGTVTSKETLPLIAKHFGIQKDIEKLTADTVAGKVPYIESFIKRVHLMASLPVDEINELLKKVPIYTGIKSFIDTHKENCVIATSNLDCWVEGLCKKVGCTAHTSKAETHNNSVVKIDAILRKEELVRTLQEQGDYVVFIGEGNNDLEAMRYADISIASGLTHNPATPILDIVDYAVYEEDTLCRLLNQLL